MPTYTVNVAFNKLAVAEEVISSAAQILSAAGFEADEIATMMRQAAEQISQPKSSDVTHFDDDEGLAGFTSTKPDIYELFERYEQIPERISLARLSKRASALGYAQTEEDFEKSFDILNQALPLVEAAQNWLINECAAAGIQVEPSKDEWLESASDEELDREDEIVFLDDWQVNGDFQLQQIETLARSYAHSGNISGYKRLVTLLGSHKVLYGSAMEDVSKAGDAFESMAEFMEFLAEHSGEGELQQSTLLDDYLLRSGFAGGTYILEGWLNSLAAEGKIQRYKRSSRWRIIV